MTCLPHTARKPVRNRANPQFPAPRALPSHSQHTEQGRLSRGGKPPRIPSRPPGILGPALLGQPRLSSLASPTFPLGAEQSGPPIPPDTTGLSSLALACRGGFGAMLCSSRGTGLTWDGIAGDGQSQPAFGSPQGPAHLAASLLYCLLH